MFVIIVLAKWILFLQFSVYRVNDYSMLFTSLVTYLLSLIQWKSGAKLLKQKLLDVFWWYFITGATGRNYTFLVIFALPIGTPNIWYFFVSSPLNLVWYCFNRNLVHVSWNNLDIVGIYTMHYCLKFSKIIGYGVPTLNTMIIFANWFRCSSNMYT